MATTMMRRLAVSTALLCVLVSECWGQCEKHGRAKLLHANTNSSGFITSPGYPGTDYPNNAQCSWQIVAEGPSLAIHLRIHDLVLHSYCRYDYVDLFDGNFYYDGLKRGTEILARLCSNSYSYRRDFYSTTPYMHVRFITDSWHTAKGFSFEFIAVAQTEVPTREPGRTSSPLYYEGDVTGRPTPSSSEADSSAGAIAALVGGIAGTFFGLVLIIAFIICICRRCLKSCLHRRPPAVPAPLPRGLYMEETHHPGPGPGARPSSREPVSYSAVVVMNSGPALSGPQGRSGNRNGHHGHARGSPDSGGQLDPSGQPHSRSRSSGRRDRGGGGGENPRHSRNLDVPERIHRPASPEGDGRGGSRSQGHPPRSRSPGGVSRPRSFAGPTSPLPPPPPPPPPVDRSRRGYSDPPPSYDEVMAACIQPSAPPPD